MQNQFPLLIIPDRIWEGITELLDGWSISKLFLLTGSRRLGAIASLPGYIRQITYDEADLPLQEGLPTLNTWPSSLNSFSFISSVAIVSRTPLRDPTHRNVTSLPSSLTSLRLSFPNALKMVVHIPSEIYGLDDGHFGQRPTSIDFAAKFPRLKCLEILGDQWDDKIPISFPPLFLVGSILHSLPQTLERFALQPLHFRFLRGSEMAFVNLPSLTSLHVPGVPLNCIPPNLLRAPSLTDITTSVLIQGLPSEAFAQVSSSLTSLTIVQGPFKPLHAAAMPSSLQSLECDTIELASIALLPKNLKNLKFRAALRVSHQRDLEVLPQNLKVLSMVLSDQPLSDFAWVPRTVTQLEITCLSQGSTHVPSLNSLPPILTKLHLWVPAYWDRVVVKQLPGELTDLAFHTVSTLPAAFYTSLPKTLRYLYISGDVGNDITTLLTTEDGNKLLPQLSSLRLPNTRPMDARIVLAPPKQLNDIHISPLTVSNELLAEIGPKSVDSSNWAFLLSLSPQLDPSVRLALFKSFSMTPTTNDIQRQYHRPRFPTFPHPSPPVTIGFVHEHVALPNSVQKLTWKTDSKIGFATSLASVPSLIDLESTILVNFATKLPTQTLTRLSCTQINVLRFDGFHNLRTLDIPNKMLRDNQASLPPSLTRLTAQEVHPKVLAVCIALEELKITDPASIHSIAWLSSLPKSLMLLEGVPKIPVYSSYRGYQLDAIGSISALSPNLTILSLSTLLIDTSNVDLWLPASITVLQVKRLQIPNVVEVLTALRHETNFDPCSSITEVIGRAYLSLIRPMLRKMVFADPFTGSLVPPLLAVPEFIPLLPRALLALVLPTGFLTLEAKSQVLRLKALPPKLDFLDISSTPIVHHAPQYLPRSIRSLIVNGACFSVQSVQYLPRTLTYLKIQDIRKWKPAMSPALPSTLTTLHIAAKAGSDRSLRGMPPSITYLTLDMPFLSSTCLQYLSPSVTRLHLTCRATVVDIPATVKVGEIRRDVYTLTHALHLGVMLRPPQPPIPEV